MSAESLRPPTTEDQPPLIPPEAPAVGVLCVVGSCDAPPPHARVVRLEQRLEIGRGRGELSAKVWKVPEETVSRRHALIERDEQGWTLRDLGSRNGTHVGRALARTERTRLTNGTLVAVGGHLAVFRVMAEDQLLAVEADAAQPFAPVSTASPVLAATIARLRALAPTERPILLSGETGTGKEVYARAVHAMSGCRGPFVPVNCASFKPDLLESELFGYKRGSHSQATEDHAGIIASAGGGILLLDEIGEMSHALQAKLLRFLQDRTYQGLGWTRPRQADVRVIAATQSPFQTLRPDVLGRFGPEPLFLPPLRRRVEDVGVLCHYFLGAAASARGGTRLALDRAAFFALCLHPWPRNVRELEATMTEADVVARERGGARILLNDLPREVREALTGSAGLADETAPGNREITAEHERSAREASTIPDASSSSRSRRPRPTREELESLLRRHRGDIPALARVTDRHREQIWRWCKEYGLDPELFRD